jgi:hypothetical protein
LAKEGLASTEKFRPCEKTKARRAMGIRFAVEVTPLWKRRVLAV